MKKSIYKYSNYQSLSKAVAGHTISHIKVDDTIRLGPATGHSAKLVYAYIAQHLAQNPLLKEKIYLLQLDEWLGLSEKDPGSCQHYLYEHIIHPWNLESDQYFLINGHAEDQEQQLKEMKNELHQKPLDLCILGIGKNGHLAFNEPGSSLNDSCRIAELADSSKKHKMLGRSTKEIRQGITLGIKEIMEAKEIILIVTGEGKTEAYHNLLDKAPVASFPASAIYEHENYSIFMDEAVLN